MSLMISNQLFPSSCVVVDKILSADKNFIVRINKSINQSNYFIVCQIVDQRTGQLSLPHLGITETKKTKT